MMITRKKERSRQEIESKSRQQKTKSKLCSKNGRRGRKCVKVVTHDIVHRDADEQDEEESESEKGREGDGNDTKYYFCCRMKNYRVKKTNIELRTTFQSRKTRTKKLEMGEERERGNRKKGCDRKLRGQKGGGEKERVTRELGHEDGREKKDGMCIF